MSENSVPPKPSVVDPVELPARELLELVRKISGLWESRDFQKFNGIGALIINTLYGGDIDIWRSRGKRHPALKQLLAHRELPLTGKELYRAIGTHEIWVRFDKLEAYPSVNATHLRFLIGMLPEEQLAWLDKIQRSGLSTRDTAAAIAGSRVESPEDVVMDALIEARTAFRQLDQITDEKDGLIADLVRAGISRDHLQPLDEALDALEAPIAEVRQALVARTSPKKATQTA